MKATELIRELERCIRNHGDLEVKYDEWVNVEGAKVCNVEWDRDASLPADRILLNGHEAYCCVE